MQSIQVEADRKWVQSELGATFDGFCSRWRDKESSKESSKESGKESINEGSLETNIQACRRLLIGDQALGWLHGLAQTRVLAGFQDMGIRCNTEGTVQIPLSDAQATLTELGVWLHSRRWVPTWRDELQTVHNLNGEPLFDLERGMFKMLGLRSQAVHIHIETPDGLVWLGKRSLHKKENPGMLDNLSAGGLGAGETPWSCVWRELDEEAGLMPNQVDLKLARDPILVSRPVGIGWHHETIHLFKGIVPRNWTPKNRDGEVLCFELTTRSACVNAVNQWRFTPDAGLVTALLLTNP
ncbi:MAG: NUDIX domain-containing protein [Limnobacter sp.]|nr:NUDIX domain-containing protein [Limnobacter sp.]